MTQRATPAPGDSWDVLVRAGATPGPLRPVRPRRVYAQVLVLTLLVVGAVAVAGSFASRRVAEHEAVNDAAQRTGVLAASVVQPALADGVAAGDASALRRLDTAVRAHVLGTDIVRVKVWTRAGTIVYSDEQRLVGQHFGLDADESSVFEQPRTKADVTDLDEPENRFERGQGKLLEVYRPVFTPDGTPLLFETYSPYDAVTSRSGDLWRGFAGVTLSSLIMLVVLLLPVLWRLLDRLRAAQQQRETLLRRAVEASEAERRRIAADLHDGLVQELAATSFTVAGAAAEARSTGAASLAATLDEAAGSVRSGIGGLRSLLVDIYPPSLESTGLAQALRDLAEGLRARDTAIEVDVPDDVALPVDDARLAFRVAQETLRNAVRHARATTVAVTVEVPDGTLQLTVVDDGAGFDVAAALDHPESGHYGLRSLLDAARDGGAELSVRSVPLDRPGHGTSWRLRKVFA